MTIGDERVEYEYEVWQYESLQAGGSTSDYATAKSEADHYALMYGQDGPVEIRMYEKRRITAPPSASVGATLSNPWTGKPRDYRDVNSDPEGVLCVEPGAPLKAATSVEGLTTKEAWWAGYRAGLGVPADMPRTEVAALLTQPQPEKAMNEHTDDSAIDRFAAAMKSKMAKQRDKGYGDWDNPAACPAERLEQCLRESVLKGDPVDVGNFAMMLFNRGQRAEALSPYNVVDKAIHRTVEGVMHMRKGLLEAFVEQFGFKPDEAVIISEPNGWRVQHNPKMAAYRAVAEKARNVALWMDDCEVRKELREAIEHLDAVKEVSYGR